ncbi:hypothetical protein SEUCBS140593_010725 [Sporothrix eucalyptigena]|uniref:Uncharacterized protein n=1 Tax=Sporothrix eucalyptigena TaxID=1812306 RepID=A0ABP0D231_9PEZI
MPVDKLVAALRPVRRPGGGTVLYNWLPGVRVVTMYHGEDVEPQRVVRTGHAAQQSLVAAGFFAAPYAGTRGLNDTFPGLVDSSNLRVPYAPIYDAFNLNWFPTL